MKRRIWFKWITSLAFVGVIIWIVPWPDLVSVLAGIQPVWVAVSMGVSFVMVLVSCSKWAVLLRAQGTPVPYGSLLKHYLVGYYFSNLLPS
ncbi:MAG: lysylphosphatidylglycerol synthase domain-containing protein, partial [Verrucomicrobiota bacterium]